ncbi:hypothetical protein [Ruegeria atlantica]|uniref:hypothetical protein n=1 Tax=Ruegeria atlantica TaxID=81569 RepID=UPI00147F1D0C|nr:hypothetical protein [Ruegeria atlantica]
MTQTQKSAKKSFKFTFSRGNFRQFFAQMTQICIILGRLAAHFRRAMQTSISHQEMRGIDTFVNRQSFYGASIVIDAHPAGVK